jgi:hypothetical protein
MFHQPHLILTAQSCAKARKQVHKLLLSMNNSIVSISSGNLVSRASLISDIVDHYSLIQKQWEEEGPMHNGPSSRDV